MAAHVHLGAGRSAGLRGTAVEVAWLSTHVATYPMGLAGEKIRPHVPGHGVAHLPHYNLHIYERGEVPALAEDTARMERVLIDSVQALREEIESQGNRVSR